MEAQRYMDETDAARDYKAASSAIRTEHRDVSVRQVIITTNCIRGDGTASAPLRPILQVWSMEGELIAEKDPLRD